MKADKTESALQRLKEYEDAEKSEHIQRCEKCGSLKITAYIDEDYFSNPLRYSCKCGNTWAG